MCKLRLNSCLPSHAHAYCFSNHFIFEQYPCLTRSTRDGNGADIDWIYIAPDSNP